MWEEMVTKWLEPKANLVADISAQAKAVCPFSDPSYTLCGL